MNNLEISISKSGRQIITIDEPPKQGLIPEGAYWFGTKKFVFESGSELLSTKKWKEWKLKLSDGNEIILSDKWMLRFRGIDDTFIASVPYKGFDYGEWVFVDSNKVLAYRRDQWFYSRFKRKLLNKKKWAKHERKRRSKRERDDDSNDDDSNDEDNIMRGLGAGNGDLLGF